MSPTEVPPTGEEEEEGAQQHGFNPSAFGETDNRRFNLEKTKNALFVQIEDNSSNRFKTFFKSSLMDRFLHTAILYFVTLFQLDAIKSDRTVTKVEEDALRSELDAHNRTLSPIYSMIIMQESDYHHTAQDKKFFEQMYEATKDILVNAFPGNYRQTIIEQELGRVLRTEQFNAHSARRQNTGHISESTLSVRELYSLKFEGDPSFKTRVLANLYQRKPSDGGAPLASVSNSPLVGRILSQHGPTAATESLRDRMPWLPLRRRESTTSNRTAAEVSRSGFLSYKGEWELHDSRLTAVDMSQRTGFDAGLHRPLPSRQGSEHPSRASSRTSSRAEANSSRGGQYRYQVRTADGDNRIPGGAAVLHRACTLPVDRADRSRAAETDAPPPRSPTRSRPKTRY